MVETLCQKTSFCNRDESLSVSGSVVSVNFRRLQLEKQKGVCVVSVAKECCESRDLFHSIAGLYSASLPDMEVEAIHTTLTKPSQTIVAIATKQDVITHRQKHGAPPPINIKQLPKQEAAADNEGAESDEDPYYHKVYSDSEGSEEEDVGSVEEEGGSWEDEKQLYLEGVRERRLMDSKDIESIGMEDRLMGCITFMKISSKPGESVSQVLLLAVRRRWRSLGIGGYLLRLCKDPSIAGQYEMLLAYADHKAESFFTRHGFTDDPIVTARHKKQADYWENSTLMAYLPPYSATQTSNISFKSVKLLDEQLKKWRTLSMASHCDQVCTMERLKQEILLLMSRVDSQQEVIDALHKELRDSQRTQRTLEVEYEIYRLQTQAKLVRLLEERARGWISAAEEDTRVSKEDVSALLTTSHT